MVGLFDRDMEGWMWLGYDRDMEGWMWLGYLIETWRGGCGWVI